MCTTYAAYNIAACVGAVTMICRRAKTGRFAVDGRLSLRCRRLPPTYRYVAAVSLACVIWVAHLVIQQACLPVPAAETSDAIALTHLPSTVDDRVDVTDAATGGGGGDRTSSRDTTGCEDSGSRNNFEDTDLVVWIKPVCY